jgi:hypothetical protein
MVLRRGETVRGAGVVLENLLWLAADQADGMIWTERAAHRHSQFRVLFCWWLRLGAELVHSVGQTAMSAASSVGRSGCATRTQ